MIIPTFLPGRYEIVCSNSRHTRRFMGGIIELLRVADNPEDAQKSSDYARSKGWHPGTEIVEVNKAARRYLGGCTE